jgi:lysozyme family protein
MDELKIDYESDEFITLNLMKEKYSNYCQKHNIKPEQLKTFKDKLDKFGAINERKNRKAAGEGNVWGWSGITWKHPIVEKMDEVTK